MLTVFRRALEILWAVVPVVCSFLLPAWSGVCIWGQTKRAPVLICNMSNGACAACCCWHARAACICQSSCWFASSICVRKDRCTCLESLLQRQQPSAKVLQYSMNSMTQQASSASPGMCRSMGCWTKDGPLH